MNYSSTLAPLSMPAQVVPGRQREGFLSGGFLPAAQGNHAGAAAVGSSCAPANGRPLSFQRQSSSGDMAAVSLTREVLDKADLESRSVFVYGFTESSDVLQRTSELLRMLTGKCGAVTGAFRFVSRASAGYERGDYASVVFLVVFDTVQAATAACRLTLESVCGTLINVQPASVKRKSHAAAERVLESFLPVAQRSKVKDRRGGKRHWTSNDFSPADRLWVVILWRNSTYVVDWREARAAARRYDAVMIDDANVLLPYTDPSLIANQQTSPGGNGYWDVELYDDGAGRRVGGNPSGPSSTSGRDRRSADRHPQQQFVQRENSIGSHRSSSSGAGADIFRSAQQQYYDEKYGRVDYSWDPNTDYYGIRGDLRRLRRFGFYCARRALRGARSVFDNITAGEQPLRMGDRDYDQRAGRREDEGRSWSSSSAPFSDPDALSSAQREPRDHMVSQGSATSDSGTPAMDAANLERLQREAEEDERVRQGGLRRRYGGVELRRPHPIEAALVWMPGVQYMRPVMNFFGFWKRDEGRRRRDDAVEFDEEDRRLALDERGGRLVRARHESAPPRRSTSVQASSGSGILSPAGVPAGASLYALESGEAIYPALQTRSEPNQLNDLSRLTADNVDVWLPTSPPQQSQRGSSSPRAVAASRAFSPAAVAAAAAAGSVEQPSSAAQRKRPRGDNHLLSHIAESASQSFAHIGSRFFSGVDDGTSSGGIQHLWGEGRGSDDTGMRGGVQNSTRPFADTDTPSVPPSFLPLAPEPQALPQPKPHPSALKRSVDARSETLNATLDSSVASMPLKRSNIRVLSVRNTKESIDTSTIAPTSAGQSWIGDENTSAERRRVTFTLPG